MSELQQRPRGPRRAPKFAFSSKAPAQQSAAQPPGKDAPLYRAPSDSGSVLVPVPSLDSTVSLGEDDERSRDGLSGSSSRQSFEGGQGQVVERLAPAAAKPRRSSGSCHGVAGPQPRSRRARAKLMECLTVNKLQIGAAQPSDSQLPSHSPAPDAATCLHVRLVGGDTDLQIFTLEEEARAQHSQPPLPGQQVFVSSLSELGLELEPMAKSLAVQPPTASQEHAAAGVPCELSSEAAQRAGEAAAASAAVTQQEEQAGSLFWPTAASPPLDPLSPCSMSAEDSCKPAAPIEGPSQLQPIMVFGTRTLAARRSEWVAEICGLNLVQIGLRLRTGSDYVPLDPMCPVVQRLLSRGGLYPQVLVSAAARFQELLEGLPPLQADAAECGVWQFGQVAAVGLDGGLQVIRYQPEAMRLHSASTSLVCCFVGCAFHEANRMDSSPGFALFTITPEGIAAVPPPPRYGLLDLAEWLGIALDRGQGGQREAVGLGMAHEAAAVAAAACGRIEGAVIVV